MGPYGQLLASSIRTNFSSSDHAMGGALSRSPVVTTVGSRAQSHTEGVVDGVVGTSDHAILATVADPHADVQLVSLLDEIRSWPCGPLPDGMCCDSSYVMPEVMQWILEQLCMPDPDMQAHAVWTLRNLIAGNDARGVKMRLVEGGVLEPLRDVLMTSKDREHNSLAHEILEEITSVLTPSSRRAILNIDLESLNSVVPSSPLRASSSRQTSPCATPSMLRPHGSPSMLQPHGADGSPADVSLKVAIPESFDPADYQVLSSLENSKNGYG